MPRTIITVAATVAVTAAVAVPAIGIASGGDDKPRTVTSQRKAAPLSQATPAATPTRQQVIEQVTRGTVHVRGKVGDRQGSGTGFVVDAGKGLIATNAHVVGGMSAIEVTLPDRTTAPARLVASSPCDDLAVLQITPSPAVTALPFGSSAGVKVGDTVTAFGFPTSLEAGETQTVSVTEGSVSAANVSSAPDRALPDYPSTIQHQAPINPGNSGGPLVDAAGRVVGINTLRNPNAQGQYYAISADAAQVVLDELKAGQSRTDIGLDAMPLSQVPLEKWYTDGAQMRADFQKAGLGEALYVVGVRTGSAADEAEIKVGDVLTSLEGSSTDSVSDICGTLKSHNPGDQLRANLVVLDSRPDEYGQAFSATMTMPGAAAGEPVTAVSGGTALPAQEEQGQPE